VHAASDQSLAAVHWRTCLRLDDGSHRHKRPTQGGLPWAERVPSAASLRVMTDGRVIKH
jgi:hypothetical protein